MFLGQDAPATTPETTTPAATPQQEPWYARPTEAILSVLGNITYSTNDYTIRSSDGTLLIDRRTGTATPAATPATGPATGPETIFNTLSRVPAIVWIGIGGLLLLSLSRR